MFADRLDNDARLWVRENQKGPQLASASLRQVRRDASTAGRAGLGLPPVSKFGSGHIPPSAYSMSALINQDESGSENGDTSVTENETGEDDAYDENSSLESSPRIPRLPIGQGYRTMARKGVTGYSSSEYGCSNNVSSSMESVTHKRQTARLSRDEESGPIGYSDDGVSESDSRSTSAYSANRTGSQRVRDSNGYTSSAVPSTATVENETSFASKNTLSSTPVLGSDGVPSAPPFRGPFQEFEGEDVVQAKYQESTDTQAASKIKDSAEGNNRIQFSSRTTTNAEATVPSYSHSIRFPNFHASAQGTWHSVVAYDACVRLCLNAWAKGCMEAPMFLENECALLREAFSVKNALLQSEEELLACPTSESSRDGALSKPKKPVGKIKVQVRRLRSKLDPPSGCSLASLNLSRVKMSLIRERFSKFGSGLRSSWIACKEVRVTPGQPDKRSLSRQSLAYVQASTQYIKQVSGLLKTGVTSLRNSSASYEVIQDTYFCSLKLKSYEERDAIRVQPGCSETYIFFPENLGDELIIDVQDSQGKNFGRALAQVVSIIDGPADKLRWLPIYHEPENELVGKLQLLFNYSSNSEDMNIKCGSVAETVAYDIVLEVAMKIQRFHQRNLLLHGSWKWILSEFSSYYGISDVYTKLRYLSYIMDVATPTAECLTLVYDLLMPVMLKGNNKRALSHHENRILGEIKEQIEQVLCMVFENYKYLDESMYSGILDVCKPSSRVPAPAIEPAIQLYTLLHDILSQEAQTNLTNYFQAAAKKRSRQLLAETDEYVNCNDTLLSNPVAMTTSYQKMAALCINIKNEIQTDIDIQSTHVLPSFIDLPNLSTAIYSTELCGRLRAFLVACPPSGPSAPVADLVIATADFQRDLASWNLSHVKGGVDAKELFHLYIMLWIQDKRLSMLESCKLDKVKWSGVRTQHLTTPFIDEMYERLRVTLDDYEVIICRWPEYIFVLENAIADIEKAIIEALDKQYADVVRPLKENLAPKKFGLKYMQKFTKKSTGLYAVPDELGILLNSMKRLIDVLRPNIESRFKSWGHFVPERGNAAPGERLSEVTVMLRTQFRGYLQAVVDKLAENTKLHNATKLKKILQESKGCVVESDIRTKLQPLRDQLMSTIDHMHSLFDTNVFIAICRLFWDRLGQDVLSFLENRKENKTWYKGSRVAVCMLDDTFGSQMQQHLGNALQEKDLEPPRSVVEVRSMLCKDAANDKGSNFYY